MDVIDRSAEISVRRGCLFLALAMALLALPFVEDAGRFLSAIAILSGLMSAGLVLKLTRLPARRLTRTEVWMNCAGQVPEAVLERAVAPALARAYRKYALVAVLVAAFSTFVSLCCSHVS